MNLVIETVFNKADQLTAGGRRISYLEIGVQEGHSFKRVVSNPLVALAVGIDTWGYDAGGTGRGNPDHVVSLLGENSMTRVMLITGNSHELLPKIESRFDLIFIDGDHTKEGCRMDMEDTLRMLRPAGIMLVDDLDHEAHTYIRGVVTDFVQRHGLFVRFHDVGCGVAEITRMENLPAY